MRRFAFAMSAVLSLAVLATPADAQLLKFGGHVAMITGLDEITSPTLQNTYGLGARIGVQPPMSPFGAFVSVTYFNPDCDNCSYWTGSAFAKLGIPLPIVSPYVLGGIQRRAAEAGGISAAENGFFAGLGVSLSSLFIEGTMEFNEDDPSVPDFDNDPIVVKAGVLIG